MSKLLLLVLTTFLSQNLLGQAKTEEVSTLLPKAILINESPYGNSETESANIDSLRNEVKRSLGSKGLMMLYCGKNCQYGEIEAHLRGINFSLRGKGLKNEEFLVLHGGFRESFMIEYWVVPEKACLPVPDSTIDIKNVKFEGTYKWKFVAYDCC
jgi:hypothetical protein